MRRTPTLLATTILMLAAPTIACAATPADTYIDRIGVNVHSTHLTSQHSQYGYGDRIAAALETAGIRHIRDGMTKASPAPHWHWGKLQYVANRVDGDIDLILDGKSWYTGPAQALDWIKTYMPRVSLVEGENEADNPGTGGTGLASATTRQDSLYAAARADTWFDDVPVLAPSFVTVAGYQTEQDADASSCHPYPGGRFDTAARLQSALDVCRPQTPGRPVYITEYGFPHTAPTSCTGQRGVTDTEAARWLPTSLLLAIQAGVPRTYLYELFDSNSCKWGLFTSTGTPRPEVTVLRNWIDLLADTGSPTRPDTALTVSDPAGATGTVQFAKSDGSFWVALYPTREGAGSRTVTLSRPHTPLKPGATGSTWSWQRYEPAVDQTARGYVTQTDTFQVPVSGDDAVLVRVRPWD